MSKTTKKTATYLCDFCSSEYLDPLILESKICQTCREETPRPNCSRCTKNPGFPPMESRKTRCPDCHTINSG